MLEKIIKDYFSFSKKERIAVLVLVMIILIFLLLPRLFPATEKITDDLEIRDFQTTKGPLASDNETRYTKDAHGEERYATTETYNRPRIDKENVSPRNATLFYFDPNKLSAEGWKRLGLNDRTINTIHNYLSRRGQFRKAEDIEKIYGLRPDDARRLLPFVKIEKSDTADRHRDVGQRFFKDKSTQHNSYAKTLNLLHPIDLNFADSATLTTLPGIGVTLAVRIVRFRERLGGFYAVEQLSEIYGLPDSSFQKIRPGIQVQNPRLSLININTADVDQLKQHPYFKWSLAAAIVSYRTQHGNYKSLDELKQLAQMTNEVYDKIVPYITL